MAATVDYSRWDSVVDSDDERAATKQREDKLAAEQRKAR